MGRAPEAGDAGGDAGEGVGARRAGEADRRGRGVLLVIGVEDEDPPHRILDDRIDLIGLGRDAEGHPEEIAGVGEVVLRVHERLADRIFIGHRRDRRHLGDQPVRGDHPLLGIGDVGAIVVEGGERADHAAHDRHRVGVAPEAAVEGRQLLVQHGVARDGVGERRQLVLLRQLAVQQQIADLHEGRILGELVDRIAAVEEDAGVAVDIGDLATGRTRSR